MAPKKNTEKPADAAPKKKGVAAAAGTEKKKRHRKVDTSSYASYIYKVLKQVHPDTGISKKAMNIMDSFAHDIFHRFAVESAGLVRAKGTRTVTSKEIMNATRLIFRGELAKHGIAEGSKALFRFEQTLTEEKKLAANPPAAPTPTPAN